MIVSQHLLAAPYAGVIGGLFGSPQTPLNKDLFRTYRFSRDESIATSQKIRVGGIMDYRIWHPGSATKRRQREIAVNFVRPRLSTREALVRRVGDLAWPTPGRSLPEQPAVENFFAASAAYSILGRRSVHGGIDEALEAFERAASEGGDARRSALNTICGALGFGGLSEFAALEDLEAVFRFESLIDPLSKIYDMLVSPEYISGGRLIIGGGAYLLEGGHNCLALWRSLIDAGDALDFELAVDAGTANRVLEQLVPGAFVSRTPIESPPREGERDLSRPA